MLHVITGLAGSCGTATITRGSNGLEYELRQPEHSLPVVRHPRQPRRQTQVALAPGAPSPISRWCRSRWLDCQMADSSWRTRTTDRSSLIRLAWASRSIPLRPTCSAPALAMLGRRAGHRGWWPWNVGDARERVIPTSSIPTSGTWTRAASMTDPALVSDDDPARRQPNPGHQRRDPGARWVGPTCRKFT